MNPVTVKQLPWPHRLRRRSSARRAFTLVEVLLAMGIFVIGFVAVAAIFPVAILLQKQTIETLLGQHVHRSAQAVISSGMNADGIYHGIIPAANDATLDISVSAIPDAFVWHLENRSYPPTVPLFFTDSGPGYSVPVSRPQRDIYWVPLVRRTAAYDASLPSVTSGDLELWVFIVRGSSQTMYPDKYLSPSSYANMYDEFDPAPPPTLPPTKRDRIPGIKSADVTIDPTEPSRYILTTPLAQTFNQGDKFLDEWGRQREVLEADPSGAWIRITQLFSTATTGFPQAKYGTPNRSNPGARRRRSH